MEQEIRDCFNSSSFLQSLSLLPGSSECPLDESVYIFNSLLISAINSCPSAKNSVANNSKSSRSVFPRNRWFDDECKRRKIIVNTSAKVYRRDPDCVNKKEKFWRERKRYKKLIISKKRRTTAEFHPQLSILRTSHPREFWKIVSKAAVVQRNYIPIDMVNMATHFQTLNTQYLDPRTFATNFQCSPLMTS